MKSDERHELPKHSELHRVLPARERAVDRDGVPGGWCAHGHRARDGDGRGADGDGDARMSARSRLPPLAQHHPSRRQERQRARWHARRDQAHRFRLLCRA